ncbi:tryptophan 2,3-dioxygenase family protein [Marinobacterium aestuariivivens]|uniref:Tryptophan 2,3-dioxygenase n=1 Tax=Marinobacterium aestuariivivens TaxID=1698799 RepID=A0ABW1ZXH5_9GAMM
MSGNGEPELYYADYLQLKRLLGAQLPESRRRGAEAHDEMLFIIVHQVYELWFRQILHELDAVLQIFGGEHLDERSLGGICAKLERITVIQHLLVEQIDVLETMAPQDFLEFRDLLVPASGFQSVQFRAIEAKLGLRGQERPGGSGYRRFQPEDARYLKSLQQQPSLFDRVDAWLARIPFLQDEHYDFWACYRDTIQEIFDSDRRVIEQHPQLTPDERRQQLEQLQRSRRQFDCLFDPDDFEQQRAAGHVRLSRLAFQAALFIHLYRDEPLLQQPFRLLKLLVEIDEQLTAWRYRHALMVQRMLGSRIGTGGSSGHEYLRKSAERTQIFTDLFNLASYLLPRSRLEPLPPALARKLDFHFSTLSRG